MAELKTLVLRRKTLRWHLTRFATYVENINQATFNDFEELEERVTLIKQHFLEFSEVQQKLEEIEPDKDEEHWSSRQEFEDKYLKLLGIAKGLLKKQSQINVQVTAPSSVSNSADVTANILNTKLPQLKLPEFSGAYDKWTQFHDTFSALIHNNSALSTIQKFYYLQGCLSGEAAQIISSIAVSEVNYAEAWKLLVERYENKRAIITSHIKGIVELSNVQKDSHNSLRVFLDTFLKHYRCLQKLDDTVQYWDTLLFYIINSKLDINTRREWENIIIKNEHNQKIEYFIKFSTERCNFLENFESKTQPNSNNFKPTNFSKSRLRSQSYMATNSNVTCYLCKGPHFIASCKRLLDLPTDRRFGEIKNLRLCTNCLRPGHFTTNCRSSPCKVCRKRHNTILHIHNVDGLAPGLEQATPTVERPAVAAQDTFTKRSNENCEAPIDVIRNSTFYSQNNASIFNASQRVYEQTNSFVFLSTATVYVHSFKNEMIKCRCLLDSGSQSNFITKQLMRVLGLRSSKVQIPVAGIGQIPLNISAQCKVNLRSMQTNFNCEVPCLVVETITDLMPHHVVDVSQLQIPANLPLADLDFNQPGKIDLLLGAGLFYELLCIGQIKLGRNLPTLQKTKLGWVVAGPMSVVNNPLSKQNCLFAQSAPRLNNLIENFWKIEEDCYSCNNNYSKEELECEEDFVKTHWRDSDGRFTVDLPVKDHHVDLGDSLENAINRFYSLERKLIKNAEFKKNYADFINEYLLLGHMTELKSDEITSGNLTYYLPHHGVEKSDSLTTKLRVVFDASSKTSSGLSLNDVLKVGPTIQSDLFSILLRFRQHTFVLTGDIAKMYRQVNVAVRQRDLQRIVWRESQNSELRHFRLNTVTYGTAPASFLATRCLKQLALENSNSFPEESRIITNDFYVDDLITGSDDIAKLTSFRRNISNILKSGGFVLRKFGSNDCRVLSDIRDENGMSDYIISDSKTRKTLGVAWNPQFDNFQYSAIPFNNTTSRISKRSILSYISQIFDPLGLLGPVVINAKKILQQLWQLRLHWDETVPQNLHTSWLEFLAEANYTKSINISRHVILTNPEQIELHGFCDASESAYGAAIYIYSRSAKSAKAQLLCAKSRVAPLKAISLPRLELCGALLLAQLSQKVKSILTINIDKTYHWTDSTIVLSWLSAEPRTWQTFICNRVSQIQQITEPSSWHHVCSAQNPADMLSRGLSPSNLSKSELWWHGPPFLNHLNLDYKYFETCNIAHYARHVSNVTEERRKPSTINVSLTTYEASSLLERFSTFSRLQRVIACCLRFLANARSSKDSRMLGPLSSSEMLRSEHTIIKMVQRESFHSEISSLMEAGRVNSSSRLASLSPFLQNDLIRVGGRLINSTLEYDKKHQIILPDKHHVTKLIIEQTHAQNFHPGPQTTLAIVRQKYWPLSGKSIVKRILHHCIVCFRASPKSISQKMGDLPKVRVTPTRAFTCCGVDYAGPFNIKDGKTKNRKIVKSYVCIFVCMFSKAIHLELAPDLTSESFLKALKRFVSRRGLCKTLFSDNASNFKGANNEIITIQKLLAQDPFLNYLAQHNIEWKFLPARSPHMGGLWEAGVKSMKHHIKRVANSFNFTYEEFYTLLTQVEAVLNSRPLTPLSDSPADLEPLTPGHFIIGGAMVAVPEGDAGSLGVASVSRYRHLQQMHWHFWARWSKEYLNQLQQRTKWRFQKEHHAVEGALVVLKEEGVPPSHWPMGRITKLHPGRDGIVRVVSVKTRANETKRAVSRICLLPI